MSIVDEKSPRTFTLSFTGSDRRPSTCSSVRTTVNFVCDVEEGRGHPTLASCKFYFLH